MSVSGLRKSYGERVVLDDVAISVEQHHRWINLHAKRLTHWACIRSAFATHQQREIHAVAVGCHGHFLLSINHRPFFVGDPDNLDIVRSQSPLKLHQVWHGFMTRLAPGAPEK